MVEVDLTGAVAYVTPASSMVGLIRVFGMEAPWRKLTLGVCQDSCDKEGDSWWGGELVGLGHAEGVGFRV